jgi:DNA repair protein RecN (Recombination protein N)
MIETLRIENLAIVAEAELEFGPGLNVLTGETGAGKSIVLSALGLLAGGRASADAIRVGADQAAIEAVFHSRELPELAAELERRGLPVDETLSVRRTLARSGRGRVRLAGELVPVAVLSELFAGRLEISSQHESQGLRRPEAQAAMLDAFGELERERRAVIQEVESLRGVDRELADLQQRAEASERRSDFLRFQVQEIDEAKVTPGEFEELQASRKRLGNAERLRRDAESAARALVGDPLGQDVPSALDQLAEAARRLEALVDLDPELEELTARLAGARAELDDAARELERYAARIDADPARLAEVEDRLASLDRLRRKYGADENAILAFRDEAAAELEAIDGADARIGQLEAERVAGAKRLRSAAQRLSKGRKRASLELSEQVQKRLRDLAMPEARFEIELVPQEPPDGLVCGPGGAEAPEFSFSANPGEAPAPMRRVASGGEMSRVFLAVKSALRRADAGMVLVFDEVDAGIGGRVADRVGRVLAELARDHQVLCITHLPQVAARADVHFRVDKRVRGGRTLASVVRLAGDAQVDEIARMAGGEKVGEATRRHARDLLRARKS